MGRLCKFTIRYQKYVSRATMRKTKRATFSFLLSANKSQTGLLGVNWLLANAHRKSFISPIFFFFCSCVNACVHLLSCLCASERRRGGGNNGCIELRSSTHPTHDPSGSAHSTTSSPCCRIVRRTGVAVHPDGAAWGSYVHRWDLSRNCKTELIMGK